MSDSDLSDNNYEDFEDDVENSLSSDDGSETSNSSIKSMEVINPENVPNSVTNVNESPQMEESIFVDAKDGSESDSSSSDSFVHCSNELAETGQQNHFVIKDNINVQINTSPLGCTSIVEQEVHRDPKWMIDSLKGGKDSTDTSATNSAPLAKNSFELNGNLADKSDSAGNFNLSKADPSSSRQPPAHSSGLDQRVLAKFHSKAPQSYEIISPKSSIDDSNLNSKPFNEKLQAALTASKCAAHSSGLDRRAYAKYPTKEDLAKKEKELVKTYTSEPPSQSSGLDPRAFAMFPTAEDLSKLSASKNTQAAAKYSYYSSQLCTLLSSTAEQQTSNQQAVKTTKDKMKDLTISEPTTNFTTDPMDISNPPKFNSKLAELKDSRLKLIKLFAETKHLKILSELVQINQKITAMQGFDDIQILNPNSPSPSLAEAKPCSSKDEFYKRPSTVSLGSIISNINDMNARYAYEQKVMISGVEPSHECPFTKILKLKTATKTHQTMLEQFLNIFSIENPLIEVEKAKESCKKIYDAMPKAVKEASFLSACPFGDYFTDKKLDQIQLVESGGDEAVAALPKPMSLLNLNDPQPSQNSKFTVVTGPSFNILPTTPTTPATTAPTSTTATSSTIEDLAIAKNVAYLQMLQCETICLEQNTAAKSDMPEEDRQNFEKRSIKAETNLKAAKEKYEICCKNFDAAITDEKFNTYLVDIINSEAFNEMEEFTKICEAIKNSEAKNQAAATTTTSAKNPLFQKAEPKTPLFKYAAKKEAMSNSCNTKTSEDGCKEIISVIPPPKFSFLQDKFKPPALQKSNCDELKTPESISKNVPPPKSEFVFNYTDCAPARSSPVGDNSAIVNAKGETVKLRAKIWEHKSEIWELKSAIQNAEKNAPQNVIYNSPTVTSPGETAKLQADIRELKRAFQDTENSRKTLIEINETLKAENKWLKDAEKEHEKDLEFKDAKIAKLQRELEDQRECMKKSSQGMLGAYGQIAKYKKQIADYEGGITFEEKIREKNVEIEKLKTDIKNQSEIMKNNNQSLFDAYAEIAKYKKQIADYQSAKNFEEKIGEKNAEIEKLQAEIKNQGELMKQGSETILDSCAQIAQLKKQLADNQGRDEVAAIKADFEAQIKDLKAQEEEILQSYQEAFEEKDEKIAEFLSSLNELTQENSDYENQVQHLKEINMKLNRQLGEKDVEITFLKAPIQILRNPIFQKSKPAVKNEMVQQQKREELERKKSEMRKMISEREKANTEQESLSKSKRNEEMIQATKDEINTVFSGRYNLIDDLQRMKEIQTKKIENLKFLTMIEPVQQPLSTPSQNIESKRNEEMIKAAKEEINKAFSGRYNLINDMQILKEVQAKKVEKKAMIEPLQRSSLKPSQDIESMNYLMKSLKVASQRISCPLQQNLINLNFEKQQKQCSEKAEVKQMLASNCLKNDTEKIAQCESKVHQPSLSKPTETEQLAPIQAKEEVEIKQALPDMSYLQYSDINAEQIMKEIQGKKLKTMLQTIQLPTLNELTNAPQKDGLTPQQQRFHDYTLEAQQKYSGIIKQVESNQKLISEWIKNGTTKTAEIQSEIEQAKTEGKNVSPEALQKILDQGQVVKDTVLNFMNILARENSKNLNKAESKDVNVDSMKAIEDGKFVELEDECEKQSLESATSACPTESTLIRITNSLQNVKFGDHQQPKESDSKLSEELIKAQKQLEYFQKLAADQAEALKNFELAKSLEKQLSAATEKTDKAEKALRKREALDSVSRDLVLKRFKEEDDDEHSPVV